MEQTLTSPATDNAPPVDLGIVIVSYNVRDRLRTCLTTLRTALSDVRAPSASVVVVDNASADNTVVTLAPEFPEVRFVPLDRNLGFSIGCNHGAALADCRWLLFLNPDTEIFPETLPDLLAQADLDPSVGAASCRILDTDGRLQPACRRSLPGPAMVVWQLLGLSWLLPRHRVFGRYNLGWLDPDATHDVEALSGSFLLVRTSVFRTLQGFDEDFFLYGEDLDLCLRIGRAGHRIVYFGGASIVHHKGQSAATRPVGARLDFYRAMVLYARKNLGLGRRSASILRLLGDFLAMGALLRGRFVRLGATFGDMAAGQIALGAVFGVYALLVGTTVYVGSHRTEFWWHLIWGILTFGSLAAVGTWSARPPRIRRSAVALAFSSLAFLAAGLLAKDVVFSRAAFVLGTFSASFTMLIRIARRRRDLSRPRERALVLGTGEESRLLGRRLGDLHEGPVVVGFVRTTLDPHDPAPLPDRLLAVTSLDRLGPVARALEASVIVVPGRLLGRLGTDILQETVPQTGLVLKAALEGTGSDKPVLVDVILEERERRNA